MKLYLNSNNSSNNTHILDESIEGKWKLLSFKFTNNIYNVNDTNNKAYVNENGTDYIITLTNGYYDSTDLETEIGNQLSATLVGTTNVSYNDNTMKFTITDTLPFYFTFGTNTTNTARKLLGFRATDGTSTTTQTSDNPIDLNTYKEIFINVEQNDDRNIFGVNYFSTSLFIYGCGANGEMIQYNYDEIQTNKKVNYSYSRCK